MPRLFLGCPLPADAAGELEAWARRELEGVRVVPAENLHVTLAFFGEVAPDARDAMAKLTRRAVWDPIPATTGALARFGRSAVGVWLGAPEEPLKRLESRMARAEESPEAWDRDDPLSQLAIRRPRSEGAEAERRNRARKPLALHLTLGRAKAALPPGLLERRMPTVGFSLERLALYESHLEPSGARYEIVAEAASSGDRADVR